MKNRIVRILISAILLSLISGIAVAILGFALGWKTSTQFSDGFFYAGAILISIGVVSVLGAISQRTTYGLQFSQSAVHLDAGERSKIWMTDLLHGYNMMAFLGISGVLLFGMAYLAIMAGSLF